MQKHNLNAEFARLAPQFLAFLDREEKKLRDEMARLKRKSTKDEQGGRFAFLRRADSAETHPNTRSSSAVRSDETESPVGGTLLLSPDEASVTDLPDYIRLLQSIQPAHVQDDDDESFSLDDTVVIQRQAVNRPDVARPTDTAPGLEFDE